MAVNKVVVYTDGASRGNPGRAAIGVVIRDGAGKLLETIAEHIGIATNNQAEYRAIIAGLEKALALGATHIELKADSELVVRQLASRYKVKNEGLKPLHQQVASLLGRFAAVAINYIPREKNREADKLANQALDGETQKPGVKVTGLSIGQATRDDIAGLCQLMVEVDAFHAEALPQVFKKIPTQTRAQYLDAILTDENTALLVAQSEGHIVGFVHVALKEAEDIPVLMPRRYAKVHDVAVKKDWHRRGVGQALMQAAERWAMEKGLTQIELDVWEFNRGAYVFYQKLGYTTASRRMWKELG